MTQDWRYRCPNGHTSWVRRVSHHADAPYYCDSCERHGHDQYRFDALVDAKTGAKVTP